MRTVGSVEVVVSTYNHPRALDLVLHGLLRQAQAGAHRSPAQKPAVLVTHSPAPSAQALACPLCAKPMVRRTAKRGANAGGEFWGCTGYPACRGTRPIN